MWPWRSEMVVSMMGPQDDESSGLSAAQDDGVAGVERRGNDHGGTGEYGHR